MAKIRKSHHVARLSFLAQVVLYDTEHRSNSSSAARGDDASTTTTTTTTTREKDERVQYIQESRNLSFVKVEQITEPATSRSSPWLLY
jgi:hypothetical protein